MDTISFILSIIAICGIFYFAKFYLPSYFQEKGKNIARKEDIATITREVEKVRTDYALQIEHMKSDLSKTIHVHKLQFETEFHAFKEIWEKLLVVRNRTLTLRPVIDTKTESEEGNKRRKQKRLKLFADSFSAFVELAEKNKPFYPKEIWNELDALIQTIRKEAIGYRYGDPEYDGMKYWDEALNNKDMILAKIESICEAIRTRIESLKSV